MMEGKERRAKEGSGNGGQEEGRSCIGGVR